MKRWGQRHKSQSREGGRVQGAGPVMEEALEHQKPEGGVRDDDQAWPVWLNG